MNIQQSSAGLRCLARYTKLEYQDGGATTQVHEKQIVREHKHTQKRKHMKTNASKHDGLSGTRFFVRMGSF